MDKKEAEFQLSLLATFKVEAEEHLKAISDGLLELEKQPANNGPSPALEQIFREAHSLKGAARSVNHDTIQSLCQSLENVLASWKQGKITTSKQFFDTLYKTGDLIGKLIKLPPKGEQKDDSMTVVELLQKLDGLIIAKQQQAEQMAEEKKKEEPKKKEESQAQIPEGLTKSKGTTIRVSLQKLDTLFQEVEEMLMVKLTFQQQMSNLRTMQNTLNEWDKKWAKIYPNILTLKKFADEKAFASENNFLLNTVEFIDWTYDYVKLFKDHLQSLMRETAQDQRLATSSIDVLLDDARKLLMQPFSTALDALPRMVRDISGAQGKNVHLDIIGADIEVDRRVLEEIKDPIIHLIRNSIDHGIEVIDVRKKANKAETGTIKIRASELSGNAMELIISDDGNGINIEKVKQSAINQGFITSEDASALSEQESLMLILKSGISTSSIITDLSGRGLGLGIVAEKVDRLGGQLFIESKLGIGTEFRIVVPLTLSTFRGVQVKAGGQDFIIPSHHVKSVIRTNFQDLKTIENHEIINFDGKAIPLIPLTVPLGITPSKSHQRIIYAIIIKAMDKMIAFSVDQVVNEQEVLVKGLGKQLKSIRNIMAVSITDSGKIIPILNPRDLLDSSKQTAVRVGVPLEQNQEIGKKKTVLIAEDSMTSRLLLKNIVESAGFKVKVAIDGLEALSLFNVEEIDLIISDIEMPRMDGFILTSKIRNLDKGKKIPIILCTSLDSAQDKEHGISVGANAYLEKSHFTQSNLLEIIQKLI